MYIELETKVQKVLFENEQVQIVQTTSGAKKAIVYRSFFERVDENDAVIVNHTGSALNLGTGGYDIVKHVLKKKPFQNDEQGHIMKLRYTPQQLSVLSVEAEESPYHSLFTRNFSLNGRYVLLAELHSMIPVIYQLLKRFCNGFTLTVIIDDKASLPLMMSEHLNILHKNENFFSITIGQAFGGKYEAVNLQTALQFAKEQLKSDFIVVSLGPGVVGTSSLYGFSGMCLADWANIIGSLDGKSVWVPRLSFAEKRKRHYGLSHHTLTPLAKFTYAESILPLPALNGQKQDELQKNLAPLKEKKQVRIDWEQVDHSLLSEALDSYPAPITTMGRTFQDDAAFFYGIYSAVKWTVSHS